MSWTGSHYGTAATGGVGSLVINHVISVASSSYELDITTTITNNYSSPLSNVLFVRRADPDNDAAWTGGSFTTLNKVESVQVNGVGHAMASAQGTVYPAFWMALTTPWPNSRCAISLSLGNLDIDGMAAIMYAGAASYTAFNSTSTSDTAIACLLNVTTSSTPLLPGSSVTFSHAYLLDASAKSGVLGQSTLSFTFLTIIAFAGTPFSYWGATTTPLVGTATSATFNALLGVTSVTSSSEAVAAYRRRQLLASNSTVTVTSAFPSMAAVIQGIGFINSGAFLAALNARLAALGLPLATGATAGTSLTSSQLALLAIKAAWFPANSALLATWGALADPCAGWVGVTCAGVSNVTSLVISNLNRPPSSGQPLYGTLPSQLANITGLATLSLFGNRLSGSIPASLFSLASLTSVDLSNNLLTGSVPPAASFGPAGSTAVINLDGNAGLCGDLSAPSKFERLAAGSAPLPSSLQLSKQLASYQNVAPASNLAYLFDYAGANYTSIAAGIYASNANVSRVEMYLFGAPCVRVYCA